MDTLLASCTDAAALAAAIAHRCPQARQHGEQWQACCPAHDDHTPSLSITPTTDKVLVYCHAQCPLDAILAALPLGTGTATMQSCAGDDREMTESRCACKETKRAAHGSETSREDLMTG